MEEIRYAVMHIDDSRLTKRTAIRNKLLFYDEADIEFINGADPEQVKAMRKKYPNCTGREWIPKVGEVGVWYSQMQCWDWAVKNNKHLMVFEDDAMLDPKFEELWHKMLQELPADYDFLSIFVPDNQENDYLYIRFYDEGGYATAESTVSADWSGYNFGAENLAKVYQGYSCVAAMYSPKGAAKLLALADEYGMWTPVDCFIFLHAHAGRLEGYAPKPSSWFPRAVHIDWEAPSTIRYGERINHELLVGEV
jgi:GR25 family glycosyltransferase involved in LPS biosynthesis